MEDLKSLRTLERVIYRGHEIVNPKVKRKQVVDQELDPFLKE
ncbi:MAG: hypothetical protein Q4E29_12540 [Lachnospiraceae bacterium]|nr:hypothetical protein [Lachnospiraceae bacterium]